MKHMEILNSAGEVIQLNDREKSNAAKMEERCNDLGFEISITTLTAIQKRILEQKFFTIAPSDYVPVRAGAEGTAWATEILTFTEQSLGGEFEQGDINTGGNDTRLATVDAGLDAIRNPIKTWAKSIHWSLPELQYATRFGNWSVVEARERARKKNYDLGIQKIAFLGRTDGTVRGLLNQAGVNINTSIITKSISSMTYAEFATFVQTILQAYRVNSNYTAWPNRFYIPESDYNGMLAPINPEFPTNGGSKLEFLLKVFREATQNPNFEIKPIAYATAANNVGVIGLNNKNRYVLTRYDEDSIRMDVPVPYTPTVANTINGFQWSNVAYSQYTGVYAYYPRETLYFDYT